MALSALDFLRRFLLHVFPAGMVRIRHYGFRANSVRRDRIGLCRKLLAVAEPPPAQPPAETRDQLLLRLTGEDVLACPRCATGRMRITLSIEPEHTSAPADARGPSP